MYIISIKAILFDLDGTLLDVDIKKFIPEYLRLLANSVSHLISPHKVIKRLISVSELINKNNGLKTNEQLFLENFFPIEGYTYDEIFPLFDKFYKTKFSELRKYTKKKEEAYTVMDAVFKIGYDVVIATTPVLPLTAIQQRLDWAGVGEFRYKLITTLENSRATKPNLIYYKQIVDYLGYEAYQCLMVGDEDKDLVAKNIGCPTFLIPSLNTDLSSEIPPPNYKGNLIDIIDLLKN